MKLSELITELKKLEETNGNNEVLVHHKEHIYKPASTVTVADMGVIANQHRYATYDTKDFLDESPKIKIIIE